jgi:hypothetical protein
MGRGLSRHLLALILGVVLALGTGASVVQSNDMAVDMALASDAGMPAHGGCDGCPDNGGAKAACDAVCTFAVAAVMSSSPILTLSGQRLPAPPIIVSASGWSSPPDPSPPRTAAAG